MTAQFRVVKSDRDLRFPVLPEVTVDGGQTWHEIPCAALVVREDVNDVTTLEITVYHERGQRREV